MRITSAAKAETRARILARARELFLSAGYEETSTRDLAEAAGIATGTLFNYFPSKEALAMTLLAEALRAGAARFEEQRHGGEDLGEELFAHVASGLRALGPYRGFVGDVLETAMSPFSRSPSTDLGVELRSEHLETVAEVLRRHGHGAALGHVTLHLYWTLYLGVLAFWTNDESRNRAESWVVLDQSMRLFQNALGEPDEPDPKGAPA